MRAGGGCLPRLGSRRKVGVGRRLGYMATSKPSEATPLKPAAAEPEAGNFSNWANFSLYVKKAGVALLFTKLNILLIFIPVTFIMSPLLKGDGREAAIFITSLLALVPLAERLGFVTEQLALYTTELIAGLLNVSCGNVPELVVVIIALRQGEFDVIQYSMIGGVLSNMMLVGGLSFLIGGMFQKTQRFSKYVVQTALFLLAMGTAGIVLCSNSVSVSAEPNLPRAPPAPLPPPPPPPPPSSPTYDGVPSLGEVIIPSQLEIISRGIRHPESDRAYDMAVDADRAAPVILLSRITSLVLLVAYIVTCFYQMYTHKEQFEDGVFDDDDDDDRKASGGKKGEEAEVEEEEDDDDEPVLGMYGSLFWMVILVILIAFMSDYLVEAIDGAAEFLNLSQVFLTAVVLPNVNNAPEHAVAIMFAIKNKLNTSVVIALGSAAQLLTFVLPLGVIFGWMSDSQLSLSMPLVLQYAIVVALVVVVVALAGKRTTWLTGALMIGTYLMIAVYFLFTREPYDGDVVLGSGQPGLQHAVLNATATNDSSTIGGGAGNIP